MSFLPLKKQSARTGFTLIELLVVMAIILILAGIVVGVQRGVYHQQAQARAKADLRTIATALESFRAQHGDYPWNDGTDSKAELFRALNGQRIINKAATPPAMEDLDDAFHTTPLIGENAIETAYSGDLQYFEDPWGNAYKYFYKTGPSAAWSHSSFILMSLGPDGRGAESGTGYNFNNGEFPQNADIYYGLDTGTIDDESDDLIHGLESQ